jgi:hypothetical protein
MLSKMCFLLIRKNQNLAFKIWKKNKIDRLNFLITVENCIHSME